MKIGTILDQIDLGAMALPEFQRGYVWNRDQVKGLMHSLYHRHPVGSLLVWVTKTETASARGTGNLQPGSVKLLLDGQQRITSLYGITRGRPPEFFDGNESAFTNLYFNVEDEVFEFYAQMKMKGNPLWIDVTDLMQQGIGDYMQHIVADETLKDKMSDYIGHLNAIYSIKDTDLHIEEVAGEDKSVDVVVDIFNRVNSGGTKLSKGDLALAKICAEWPEARAELKKLLSKWREAGFQFKLEWLLRIITTITTGEAFFTSLKNITIEEFQQGVKEADKMVGRILDLISSRLGLDHDRVLGSKYSFPLMARYLHERKGQFEDHRERDKLLYWYIHTFLWGRYAGSTESVLSQDLNELKNGENTIDDLINLLRRNRGDLSLNAEDFRGWSRSARFYPLLYMLTRVWHAQDWGTGIELTNHLLGKLASLQLHHIFPKAYLYEHEYSRADVNALANFTFLTQETNLKIMDKPPEEYFEGIVQKNPGALESHWIPMDRSLWKVENYLDFLEARRQLLADAANDFLDSLIKGELPEAKAAESIVDRKQRIVPGGVEGEEEEAIIQACNSWVVEQGLPEGDYMYEVVDTETNEPLAVLDLAWPDGLQEGFSQPVALLIDEDKETKEIANRAGFLFFTDVEAFKMYVKREILAQVEEAD